MNYLIPIALVDLIDEACALQERTSLVLLFILCRSRSL